MVKQPGFWNVEERLQEISADGGPLETLAAVDFERFRPTLERAAGKPPGRPSPELALCGCRICSIPPACSGRSTPGRRNRTSFSPASARTPSNGPPSGTLPDGAAATDLPHRSDHSLPETGVQRFRHASLLARYAP